MRLLREVAASTPQVEVTWNLDDVKRSLQFVAETPKAGDSAKIIARVFPRTEDAETRRLCLDALYRIKDRTAKNQLLRIYRNPETGAELRATVAEYLRKVVIEDRKLTPAQAKALLDQVGGK